MNLIKTHYTPNIRPSPRNHLRSHLHLHSQCSPLFATLRPNRPEHPDSDDSDASNRGEEDENYLSDPHLRKYYYIDPGMIQYQRASFEQLFHHFTVPLTGYELRRIVEGRRLKLSVEDMSVILLVYHQTWEDTTDETWNSIAELLTDWAAEKIVRETLPIILSCSEAIADNPIKIPLRVRHVSNEVHEPPVQ